MSNEWTIRRVAYDTSYREGHTIKHYTHYIYNKRTHLEMGEVTGPNPEPPDEWVQMVKKLNSGEMTIS
jgi:hypothetical protein